MEPPQQVADKVADNEGQEDKVRHQDNSSTADALCHANAPGAAPASGEGWDCGDRTASS
jgi:hypothetical protein